MSPEEVAEKAESKVRGEIEKVTVTDESESEETIKKAEETIKSDDTVASELLACHHEEIKSAELLETVQGAIEPQGVAKLETECKEMEKSEVQPDEKSEKGIEEHELEDIVKGSEEASEEQELIISTVVTSEEIKDSEPGVELAASQIQETIESEIQPTEEAEQVTMLEITSQDVEQEKVESEITLPEPVTNKDKDESEIKSFEDIVPDVSEGLTEILPQNTACEGQISEIQSETEPEGQLVIGELNKSDEVVIEEQVYPTAAQCKDAADSEQDMAGEPVSELTKPEAVVSDVIEQSNEETGPVPENAIVSEEAILSVQDKKGSELDTLTNAEILTEEEQVEAQQDIIFIEDVDKLESQCIEGVQPEVSGSESVAAIQMQSDVNVEEEGEVHVDITEVLPKDNTFQVVAELEVIKPELDENEECKHLDQDSKEETQEPNEEDDSETNLTEEKELFQIEDQGIVKSDDEVIEEFLNDELENHLNEETQPVDNLEEKAEDISEGLAKDEISEEVEPEVMKSEVVLNEESEQAKILPEQENSETNPPERKEEVSEMKDPQLDAITSLAMVEEAVEQDKLILEDAAIENLEYKSDTHTHHEETEESVAEMQSHVMEVKEEDSAITSEETIVDAKEEDSDITTEEAVVDGNVVEEHETVPAKRVDTATEETIETSEIKSNENANPEIHEPFTCEIDTSEAKLEMETEESESSIDPGIVQVDEKKDDKIVEPMTENGEVQSETFVHEKMEEVPEVKPEAIVETITPDLCSQTDVESKVIEPSDEKEIQSDTEVVEETKEHESDAMAKPEVVEESEEEPIAAISLEKEESEVQHDFEIKAVESIIETNDQEDGKVIDNVTDNVNDQMDDANDSIKVEVQNDVDIIVDDVKDKTDNEIKDADVEVSDATTDKSAEDFVFVDKVEEQAEETRFEEKKLESNEVEGQNIEDTEDPKGEFKNKIKLY